MAYTGGEFFADFKIKEIREDEICLHWEKYPGAGVTYRLYWSDRDTPDMQYRCIYFGEGTEFSYTALFQTFCCYACRAGNRVREHKNTGAPHIS